MKHRSQLELTYMAEANFSKRSTAPAAPLTLDRVTQLVKEALDGIHNPPLISVVGTAADLRFWAPEGVMGVVTSEGRVILVASGHSNDIEVFRTVFHEVFHKGLRNVLPQDDYVLVIQALAKREVLNSDDCSALGASR